MSKKQSKPEAIPANWDEMMQQADINVQKVFDGIAHRVSPNDMERIRDAYFFAKEAHYGQMRKSGDPYIFHPIAVAAIIGTEMELEPNVIMAAFLHDVVEDTPVTNDQIKERYGEEVAKIVDIVTKKPDDPGSKQVAAYRRIINSAKYGVSAIFLKFADRLHNMRTLNSMSSEKQIKIASETDHFYAPLANRFGLYQVKTEMEDLTFKYRNPIEYSNLEIALSTERKAEWQMLNVFMEQIASILKEEGIEARTEIRYRNPYSIWRKMQRRGVNEPRLVDGKQYIRIIFPNSDSISEKDMALRIYSALTSRINERPHSVTNYITTPKDNGYQSFHVHLLSNTGMWEEIHISSDEMIRSSQLGCASKRVQNNVHEWLSRLHHIINEITEDTNDIEFMNRITSTFYNDNISVFTPKGKAIALPKGATALDFAFEIHTEVGRTAATAIINGRLQPLDTELGRGDCVEIRTTAGAKPSPEWMQFVHTDRAKDFLRRYFRNLPHLEYVRCEECNPLPGDEVVGFDSKSGITIHKRNCNNAIRLAAENGDSIKAVNFTANDAFLYPVTIRIRGVDRYHLMRDLIDCITDQMKLSMHHLATENQGYIANCTIDLSVHSLDELRTIMQNIKNIDGIDEVTHIQRSGVMVV